MRIVPKKIASKLLPALTIVLMLLLVVSSSCTSASAQEVRGKRILFDRTHGEWSAGYDDFSRVAMNMGYTLVPYFTGPLTLTILWQYDILILPLPRSALSSSETYAIQTWVRYYGGRLLVISEWGDYGGAKASLNSLVFPMGVQFNFDTLVDPTDYDVSEIWIKFHNFGTHPTTSGLSKVWLLATASMNILNPAVAKALVMGDSDTYSTGTLAREGKTSQPTETGTASGKANNIAATASTYGSGRAVCVGDSDLFELGDGIDGDGDYLNDLYEYDNAKFLTNILNWLTPTPQTEWTFMVYLDGDNNLEGAALYNLNQMETVGSTDKVNIIVLLDRLTAPGGWIYYIQKDYVTGETWDTFTSPVLVTFEYEPNMGDPSTLTNFIEWTMQNYPAKQYALVLWDHGSGWKRVGVQFPDKGVCFDDTNEDYLTTAELKKALYDAGEYGYLNLIGFDACLMAMVEIGYQIRQFGDVMVASEETIPWNGWPYDTILSDLKTHPTYSSTSLGARICVRYIAFYGSGSGVTLSAINLKKLEALASEIASFAVILQKHWSCCQSKIKSARAATEDMYDPDYADLIHFARKLYATYPHLEVRTACTKLISAVTSVVIKNVHGSLHPQSTGLTIYFPEYSYNYGYDSLDLALRTKWNAFLYLYLGLVPS